MSSLKQKTIFLASTFPTMRWNAPPPLPTVGSASRSEFAPTGLLASGRFRRRSAVPLPRRVDGRRASGALTTNAMNAANADWSALLQIQRDEPGIAVAIGDQQHRDLLALPLERIDALLHVGGSGDRLILHLDNHVAGRQPLVGIGRRHAGINAGDEHAVDPALDLKFAPLLVG